MTDCIRYRFSKKILSKQEEKLEEGLNALKCIGYNNFKEILIITEEEMEISQQIGLNDDVVNEFKKYI